MGSVSGDVVGEGEDDGIDCATPRKKSNMYWREAGSYCEEEVTPLLYIDEMHSRPITNEEETYVNGINIAFMKRIHMAIRKQTIRKQR